MNELQNNELPFLIAIYTILICILFGVNSVAIKITLKGIGPFTLAGFRFGIAAVAITLWAKYTKRKFFLKEGQYKKIFLISVIFTIQLSLLYWGMNKTNASRAILLMNLEPFVVLLLAHFFIPGDTITFKKCFGMIFGFCGVALIILNKQGVSEELRIGDCAIIGVAIIWALNTIYVKRILHAFQAFQIVMYPMYFAVPCFFMEGILWDKPMVFDLNIKIILALLYQSLVTVSFGFVAWNYLLKKYKATSLNSFIFIMPISGVILSRFLLNEPLTMTIWLSLILIVSGIILLNYKKKLFYYR